MRQNDQNRTLSQIRSFQNGEENGFNFFFRQYYPALTYYSFKIVNDQAEAEEIASEALIKLWERRDKFDSYLPIKSFLYTTVRNASVDYLRKQNRAAKNLKELGYITDLSEKNAFELFVEGETYQEILSAISALPPQCKRIFSMLFFEGKEYPEIARELNLTEATVRSQKARAITLIRRQIGLGMSLLISLLFLHSE